MVTVTLKMRYGPRPLRESAAWYIADGEAAAWLDEVAAWDVDHSEVRLLAVPRSASDRRPAGALVVLLDGSRPTKPSPRCVPYGMIAQRVYLPVDGWLEPEVSDAELDELWSDSHTYVWHPVSGLVAFESADHLRLHSLLKVGPLLAREWDRAVEGVAISSQLISLAPDRTLTIDLIMGEGRDDIGTEKGAIADLPPSPQEPKTDILSKSTRHARRMLANIIHYLAEKVPATGDKPTWINHLDDWARAQLANLQSGLMAARNKEILRLLHLLETDPARGLRFAIPLAGDPHRGLGPPGGRLAERPTDFNLGRLGGGHPADIWDLSSANRIQLTRRYRELANREIQLGRHRRAAYIFAELVADFEAAASTLADGRHWREAAVLYQQRLRRPLDAARCLEQGGLWTEAIALYDELHEHEKAGDLLARIGQMDRARQHYHEAVNQHRIRGDLLAAARLLDEKLGLVDDALEELSAAWPDSPQAGQCLRKTFELLARLGRHGTTRQWLADFRDGPLPARRGVDLVDILTETATNYPDRTVREAAADCTRVQVARQLRAEPASASQRLLAALARLAPEDRLLGRDCRRYMDQRPAATTSRQLIVVPKKRPRLLRTIRLPGNEVVWKAAAPCGNAIFVAGVGNDHLLVTRCSWHQVDSPGRMWPIEPGLAESPVILAADPWTDDAVLVHVVGGRNLNGEHRFPPTDACPVATIAGSMPAISPRILAAARTTHGFTWLLERGQESLTLIGVSPHGELLSAETLPDVSAELGGSPSVLPVPLQAQDDAVYVGLENTLIVLEKGSPQRTVEFARRITALGVSAPKTRTRVAVSFEVGGNIWWDSVEHGHAEAFASDITAPLACFTKGGHLIAVGPGGCEVYSTQDQRLRIVAELAESNPKPIAVLPGPNANQFGIMSEASEIKVYELP